MGSVLLRAACTATLKCTGAASVNPSAGATTNGSGVATFKVTDTTVQTVTCTATDATDNIVITQTASVKFVAVPTTLTQSAAAPNIIPLSTPETIVLTSTLVDTATGTAVSGATVTFTINGTTVTCTGGPATTNSSGVATCSYAFAGSPTAEVLTVGSSFSAATVGSISYAASGAGTPSETITVGGTVPTFAWTTAPPVTAQTYGATFTVAASTTTAHDSGTVSYSVTGGCTIASGGFPTVYTVTMTSGTTACMVTATLAGYVYNSGSTHTYFDPETLGPVTVNAALANPAAITVTGAPASAAYQTTFSVGTSGGSAADTGAITFAASGACSDVSGGSTILMTAGTGTCSVTATQAADSNYNSVTSAAVTVAATSANATMTINCPTGDIYDGAPQGCTATSTTPSGLTVDFTYNGSSTVPTNAGTYSVVGTIDTSSQKNYSGTSSPVTFVINPEPVTAVAGNLNAVYTGAAQTIGACQFNGSFTANLSCVDNPATETEVGTGSVSPTVTYNNGDVAANYTISDQNGTWTITQASSSVALVCTSPDTYTGSQIKPCTATVTAPGPTLTATIQYANNIDVGTAAAVATFTGNTDVTSSSSTLVTFTITALPATISLGPQPLNFAYTGSQVPVTVTTTPTGLTYSISYTGITPTVYAQSSTPPTNPGSYTVVATITNPNYSGTATGTEVIGPITPPMILSLDPGSSNPSLYGTAVSFDLNVNNGAAPAPCPTGTVQFYVNDTASGSPVTLPATCDSSLFYQIATLPVGPGHHLCDLQRRRELSRDRIYYRWRAYRFIYAQPVDPGRDGRRHGSEPDHPPGNHHQRWRSDNFHGDGDAVSGNRFWTLPVPAAQCRSMNASARPRPAILRMAHWLAPPNLYRAQRPIPLSW